MENEVPWNEAGHDLHLSGRRKAFLPFRIGKGTVQETFDRKHSVYRRCSSCGHRYQFTEELSEIPPGRYLTKLSAFPSLPSIISQTETVCACICLFSTVCTWFSSAAAKIPGCMQHWKVKEKGGQKSFPSKKDCFWNVNVFVSC